MKKCIYLAVVAALLLSTSTNAQIKINTKTISAGAKAVKAATLSDAEVVQYTKEYIDWMDKNNPVAPDNHWLATRLKKIATKLQNYDGLNLNFKVYLVKDVNAFACADGSVRVCAGLMQVMNDNEVLGVLGHEIGHVKNKDSRDAFRTALLTGALKEGVSSQGGAAAALSDSQLGGLAEAVANSSFSRKQESEADSYGYTFLKNSGSNPWYMAHAFQKLKAESEAAGAVKESGLNKMFSSHPDTDTRLKKMTDKATKDGIAEPAKEPVPKEPVAKPATKKPAPKKTATKKKS